MAKMTPDKKNRLKFYLQGVIKALANEEATAAEVLLTVEILTRWAIKEIADFAEDVDMDRLAIYVKEMEVVKDALVNRIKELYERETD